MPIGPASYLQGIGEIPASKPAALAWLKRMGITAVSQGQTFLFDTNSLPERERRAYTARAIAALELDPSTYDEDAHAALIVVPPGIREEAEGQAGIARIIRAGRQSGLGRGAAHQAVWDAFGLDGNCAKSLDRLEARIADDDPVNLAPVLLAKYKGGAPRAEMSP